MEGWVDEEGNFYPDEGGADWVGGEGYEPQEEDLDAVNKGKGKGKGVKCYNCEGYGHLARDCPKPKRQTKGGGKGGKGGKGGYRTNLMTYLKGKYGSKAQGRGKVGTAKTKAGMVKGSFRITKGIATSAGAGGT